jgi:CHAD domain-containing protein
MTSDTKKISRKLTSRHKALLEEYDDEDLHQLRINIRRARALLKSQSDKPSAALRKDWGRLAQKTNTARDWDTLAIYAAGVLPSTHWRTLQPLVEDYRQQAHASVLKTLRSRSWHTTLSRWNKWVKQSDTQAFAEVTLLGGKRKVAKRALKAGRRAMMRRDERSWHKFRIAIKNLRYRLDYSSVKGDREKDDLKAIKKICKRLQDELGNWHDTVVHRNLLVQIADDPGVGGAAEVAAALGALAAAIEASRAESLVYVASVLESEWQVLAAAAGET